MALSFWVSLLVLCAVGAVGSDPNPIIPAAPLLTHVNDTTNGKLYRIVHGEHIKLWVMHVYGSAEEMGMAHGELLGDVVHSLMTKALPDFYRSYAGQIPTKGLPDWLAKLIKEATKEAAPEVFELALDYVLDREKKHMEQSPSHPLDEMHSIAKGACASGKVAGCDVDKFTKLIYRTNLLPELIRMTCSILGAWGVATPTGTLSQLRALDFGSSPFANYTLLTVYHPTDGNTFATLGFPGLVGAVTGFSTKVGLSEKVWETYNGTGLQPGHYDGLPVVGMIRDMLQFSDTKEDAYARAATHTRTWAVFLGVGDSQQTFEILGYREKDLAAYSWDNITAVTAFPSYKDVVYVDKHPQPSHDHTTMPGLVSQYHGNLTGEVVAQNFPRIMGSGDLHVAVYDYGRRKVWIALGWIDSDGNYGPNGEGKACYQPYLEFDMDALFTL